MLFPFQQIQEHKLRFVQFLPDVVRLQRLLMDRFHRRMDRTDAENYTVREFLKDLPVSFSSRYFLTTRMTEVSKL